MNILILISIVVLLLMLLFFLSRPNPPTLKEVLLRIQSYGLNIDPELTSQLDNWLESSKKNELKQAWFRGLNMSLKYFRSVYLDSVLETVDIIFTDGHGAGGLILHYVDGNPINQERPGNIVTPLQKPGQASFAWEILIEVRQAHKKQTKLIEI